MCRLGTSTQWTCLAMVSVSMCMVDQNSQTGSTVDTLWA